MTLTCTSPPPICGEQLWTPATIPPEVVAERLGDNQTAQDVWHALHPLVNGSERTAQFDKFVSVTPLVEVTSDVLPTDLRDIGYTLYLEDDSEMPGGAYKFRGVVSALLAALEANPNLQTIVAASTGNHAAAVALAATLFGLRSVVYMPEDANSEKVANTAQYGAEIFYKSSLGQAVVAAEAHGNRDGAKFIHPYNQIEVIAGQGTIATQILAQLGKLGIDPRSVDVEIFNPVGGGGNAAGCAVACRALATDVRIHIVQGEGADVAIANIQHRPFDLAKFDPAVDGAAVKYPGKLPMKVLRSGKFVHGMSVVSHGEIGEAMAVSARMERPLEPAGALALAGALAKMRRNREGNGVLVAHGSGANTTAEKVHHFADAAYKAGKITSRQAFDLISAANLDGRRAPNALEELAKSLATQAVGKIAVRQGCRVLSGY